MHYWYGGSNYWRLIVRGSTPPEMQSGDFLYGSVRYRYIISGNSPNSAATQLSIIFVSHTHTHITRRGTGAVRTVLYGNPLLVQNPSQIAYRTVPYRLCCVFFYVNRQGFRRRPEQHMGMREIIRPQPISPSRFFCPSRKGMYILLSPFSLGYAA